MKTAIIGSRSIIIKNLSPYIPDGTTEIVSGGAIGIDTCAKQFASAHHIPLTKFLPNYKHYGRSAPLKRNLEIIEYADCVVAIWDGISRGTKFVIDKCHEQKKPVMIHIIPL